MPDTDPQPVTKPPERIDAGTVTLLRTVPDHAAALARVVDESYDTLAPWLSWVNELTRTVDGQHARCVEAAELWDAGTEFTYVVATAEDERVVGTFGLHRPQGSSYMILGYWMHKDTAGKGYATAAARGVTEAVLALPDIDRVEVYVNPANERSVALVRRAGYTRDAEELIDGRELWAVGAPAPARDWLRL